MDIEFLPCTTIVQGAGKGRLLASRGGADGHATHLEYSKLILAVGARELFLPFPGWTLPGVMGAGGLQAMCKSGLNVKGKRIVVGGSGPLLLAVAAYLKKKGANIPAIVEQANAGAVNRFAMGLVTHPGKLMQGAALKASLWGVPYWTGSWPVRASGTDRVASVTIRRAGASGGRLTDIEIPCDFLACGFGLVPNTQLAAVLSCDVAGGVVRVDDFQETSVENVFCAGEPTGIGGVEVASVQGQIAGLAATGGMDGARRLFGQRARALRFAGRLETTFALRDELRSLADDQTICCRCEDVTMGVMRTYSTWREAKLQVRCGMGPCQGRICGAIARYLWDLHPEDCRPPITPVSMGTLAGSDRKTHA